MAHSLQAAQASIQEITRKFVAHPAVSNGQRKSNLHVILFLHGEEWLGLILIVSMQPTHPTLLQISHAQGLDGVARTSILVDSGHGI